MAEGLMGVDEGHILVQKVAQNQEMDEAAQDHVRGLQEEDPQMVDMEEGVEAEDMVAPFVVLLVEEEDAVGGLEEATLARVLVHQYEEGQQAVWVQEGGHLATTEVDDEGLSAVGREDEEEGHIVGPEAGAHTLVVRAHQCRGVEVVLGAHGHTVAQGHAAAEGDHTRVRAPAHGRFLLDLAGVVKKAQLIKRIAEMEMTFEVVNHVVEAVHHRLVIQSPIGLLKGSLVGNHALQYYLLVSDILTEIHMKRRLIPKNA